MASVYLHKFPNGKFYVGATSRDPAIRWANGKGYSGQPRVAEAIEKYGWENVEHFTFNVSDIYEAERLETFLINALDSINNGYNTLKSNEGKKEDVYVVIGEMVRRHRVAKQMTQEDLAKLLGCTKAMVSKIEDGKTRVYISTMSKLVSIFRFSADELNSLSSYVRKE